METGHRASRGRLSSAEVMASNGHERESSWGAQDEEVQPLLRGGAEQQSREFSQQQFRRAQQEAVQTVAMNSGWLTAVFIVCSFCIFGFWFYVNVKSWYMLFEYYSAPCDQPLSDWLLVKLILDVVSSVVQNRSRHGDPPGPLTLFILGLQNIWLIMGFQWCGQCKTCQTMSPELFNWVQFLVIFGTVVMLLCMLLPVLFYMAVVLLVFLIGSGRMKNSRAAREDTLKLLEVVEYSPDLFSRKDAPEDNRPPGDCCCCCENFNDHKVIVRTPCAHYFHQDCLGEWLKLAKTCPICRCDLDAATEELGIDKELAAAGVMEDLEEAPLQHPRSSGASASGSRGSRQDSRVYSVD